MAKNENLGEYDRSGVEGNTILWSIKETSTNEYTIVVRNIRKNKLVSTTYKLLFEPTNGLHADDITIIDAILEKLLTTARRGN